MPVDSFDGDPADLAAPSDALISAPPVPPSIVSLSASSNSPNPQNQLAIVDSPAGHPGSAAMDQWPRSSTWGQSSAIRRVNA
jgi:hypothetical protein